MPNPFLHYNKFQKLLLKIKDPYKYQDDKRSLKMYQNEQSLNQIHFFDHIKKARLKSKISIKHSGNLGDLIYALPIIKELGENRKIDFFVDLNFTVKAPLANHYLGNKLMDIKTLKLLNPLLKSQSYLNCQGQIFNNQEIDFDFDFMRSHFKGLQGGNITRWCSYLFNIFPNFDQPWLSVNPNYNFKDVFLIARSSRYRNTFIDYSFLDDYPNKFFIGLEDEYKNVRKDIKSLEFLSIKNFLELAEIIAGAKFIIGNQSFIFSLAEALKVPRILEISPQYPNVIPLGNQGYDFYFQHHFIDLVKTLISK